ncbi:MAG: T9SS type A sorting domain-containing protein [Bacteroidales bacterium]|nr:T9SS type A sorting domain-containing protein [Bacteroidales bacterium]
MNLRKALIFQIFLICFVTHNGISQKVIFLHHSTGENLYNEGNVPERIEGYNLEHGTNYEITEFAYPNWPYPWDNYPYDYWNLWVSNACDTTKANVQCLYKLCSSYDVIIFKHCYPGSAILEDEEIPNIASNVKTIANYKLQYRALRDLMDNFPNNKFIVWTLAPLHRLSTNPQKGERSRQFVEWVTNEWLSEDGKQHTNIYLFDFWEYTAEHSTTPENGKVNCLKYIYERDHSSGDSHPNQFANETIGPLFADFIIQTIQSSGNIKISSIDITGDDNINTDNGSVQLAAQILPDNAANKSVTWEITSGKSFASVSSTGLVTALDNGEVEVKVTAQDGSGSFATHIITISNQIIPVESIQILGNNPIHSGIGNVQLSAQVIPSNATDKNISWTILSGSEIASVNQSGLFTSTGEGKVTIKVSSHENLTISDTIQVIVSSSVVLVEDINIYADGGFSIIDEPEGTLQLFADVLPENATEKSLVWAVSENNAAVSIDQNGMVNALINGTAVVTASALDGSGVSKNIEIVVTNQNQSSTVPDKFDLKKLVIYHQNNNMIHVYSGKGENAISIEIIDPNGRTLYRDNLAEGSSQISIEPYPSGIYIVIVKNSSSVFSKKIVRL